MRGGFEKEGEGERREEREEIEERKGKEGKEETEEREERDAHSRYTEKPSLHISILTRREGSIAGPTVRGNSPPRNKSQAH